MKFSVQDFLSRCEQIGRKLQNCSHLLKKSLTENFFFYATNRIYRPDKIQFFFVQCLFHVSRSVSIICKEYFICWIKIVFLNSTCNMQNVLKIVFSRIIRLFRAKKMLFSLQDKYPIRLENVIKDLSIMMKYTLGKQLIVSLWLWKR